jgi:hypothetical protein
MFEEIRNLIIEMNENKRREIYFENHYSMYLNIIRTWGKNRWSNFTQLLYHFHHQLEQLPSCRCGKSVKFKGFNRGYNKYCSSLCASTDTSNFEKKLQKARDTCLRKYGVDNPSKLQETKEKIKKTSLSKYGVDNFTKTNEYLEKVKKTNISKWGKEWFMETSDFKEKTISTNLRKYGTEHHTQSSGFKKDQRERDEKKWSSADKSQHYRMKRQAFINSEKFIQALETQRENNKIKFFNYYENYNKSVELISISRNLLRYRCNFCNLEFNISKQLLYLRTKHEHDVCTWCNPTNSKNYSQMERNVKQFIESIYKKEIIQNYKIDKQEIDIFMPELSLGFDFNGLFWHSEKYKNKSYHLSKKLFFKEKGIQLIYIWENDWIDKGDIVKSMIKAKLGYLDRKIDARKCVSRVINDKKQIKKFFESNHLDGYLCNRSTTIAIYHNQEIVMMGTFSMRSKGYELSRFASLKNIIVIGGLSKIIKHFIDISNVDHFFTYSDYSRTDGSVYEKLNFKIDSFIEPNYFWAKNKKKVTRGVTGAFKVWNCGYQKWIFTA